MIGRPSSPDSGSAINNGLRRAELLLLFSLLLGVLVIPVIFGGTLDASVIEGGCSLTILQKPH